MKYTIFLAFLLLLGGCNENFLEQRPIGALDETVLATESGVNGLLIGAYSLLDGNGSVGSGDSFIGMNVLASMPSDDSFVGTIPNALLASIEGYTYDPTTTVFNTKWRVQYAAIQRCNDVLRILPKVEQGESEATQIEAEARFLRAVYHLNTLLLWRNIPFIDETISYSSGNYNVSNTEPVWPKIEADFQFAADHLTDTKAEVGRANKWAAKAFLVKAYMFQHKFDEAAPLLDDIIENGVTSNGLKYDLAPHYFDNFSTSKKHGPEAVFVVQMSVRDGANGQNGNTLEASGGPYGSPATTGYGWTQPKFDLVNAYQTDPETGLPLLNNYNDHPVKTDQGISSAEAFIPHDGPLDSRLDWNVGRRGIPFLDWGVHPGQAWIRSQNVGGPFSVIKHIAWKNRKDTDIEQRFTNSPYNLIRFADVLLWAAEVEVEKGNLAKAETYVNRIRARAANPEGWVKKYINDNNPDEGFSSTPAANYKVGLYTGQFVANGQEFSREAVRMERRLELALEHHRLFDLQRYDNGSGYMANTLNRALSYHRTIVGFDYSYVAEGTFTQGKNEIYPIPQAQIDLSMKEGKLTLVQNPNY